MNGNCHFIYGAAWGSMAALNLDKLNAYLPNITNTPETACLFVLGGLIGGIFPDMDNPTSHMGKLSVPVSTFIATIGGFMGKKGAYHRGIMHDPLIYAVGLLLSYLYFPPLLGFFVGCMSHVFLDMFNPVGVPFMLGAKHLHMAKIKSGSKESVLLTWVLVVIVLVAGFTVKFGFPTETVNKLYGY